MERKISSSINSQYFKRERRLRCFFFLLEDLFPFYSRLHAPWLKVIQMISTLVLFPETPCTPLLLADTKGPTRPQSQASGRWSRGGCVFSNQHSLQEVLGTRLLSHSDWVSVEHVTPWEPMRPLGISGVERLAAPSWIFTYYAARCCLLLEWEKLLKVVWGGGVGVGGTADRPSDTEALSHKQWNLHILLWAISLLA